MNYLEYREARIHGTPDFPFALYTVDKTHPSYNMACHWHSEYEIIRVLSGRLHITLDRTEYTAHPGDMLFISGGVLHSGTPDRCAYECAVFDMSIFTRAPRACQMDIIPLLNQDCHIRQLIPDDEEAVREHTGSLFDAFKLKRQGFAFEVTGALYCLLGKLIEGGFIENFADNANSGIRQLAPIKKVLSFIWENYHYEIKLNDLAIQADMNRNYFCRYFKNITQKTPVEYLNYYRVERACERLTASDESVTNIALSCGFNDSGYFIKVFKKLKGVTPSQYVRDHSQISG